ncbi:hypothetical protein ABZ502_32670 [Streptomyces abikoensis]|uniref:hypothetical protein n=1 Tax=Streptomyces abikoensis TaxID=97398 RepID=UPI0033E2C70D
MRSKKFGFLVALVLLAFAFPTASLLIFKALCVIVGAAFIAAAWMQAHLSLVLFVGAIGVLAYYFPDAFRRAGRWLARSVADAVRSVMPETEPETDSAGSRPDPAAAR